MIRSTFTALLILAGLLAAKPNPVKPDPNSPRPIEAVDTVFMEDMTWMEIRDALKNGKTTVLVSTGGIEQNGPYLVTGKHNIILRATTEAIARQLGNALVAPIVPFVPEGNIDPPSGHMLYPGTISLTEATYEALLTEICRSLKAHGFTRIVLIGDSGGNQTGMEKVAQQLNSNWADDRSRAYYIAKYYDFAAVTKWLEAQGIRQESEGLHDDFAMTAMMMSVDPSSVRSEERIAADKFRINGVELAPQEKTIDWGRKIVNFRAAETIKALKQAMGE